jgi:DNA polymerase-1
MYPQLEKFDRFAFDTETTGLQYRKDVVFGFSLSTPDGKDYYYDIRENPKIIQWFNDAVRDYEGTIICHNASFDFRMSYFTGLYLPLEQLDDTAIRAALINEWERSYSLDNLGEKHIGATKDTEIYEEAAQLLGGRATRNVQIGRIHELPSHIVSPYAKKDTRITLDLWDWQQSEIERQGIQRIVKFERAVMPQLIRTEMAGVNVDLEQADKSYKELDKRVYQLTKSISHQAGFDVNVNSAAHMKRIFEPRRASSGGWETKDGISIASTPKGAASLAADSLRVIGEGIAADILKVRSLMKTRDTFIEKYVINSNIGGRVYPNINQMKGEAGGTYSGRLSYTGVALQQIPSRNPTIAAIVKPLFLPDDDCEWGDTDMASFEVRVAAHLMNDRNILSAYDANPRADFHQIVADIMGIPRTAS